MVGTGTKLLMIIMFIHLFLYIGVENTRAITQPFIEDYGHVTITEGNLTEIITDNQTLEDYNISVGDDITSGTGLYTYNPLDPIWGFFTFAWGLLTSPLALLSLDIHWAIKLMFIVPLGFLYLLTLISFARGKDL